MPRFNLRLVFVLVTALTLLLGLFHRPLGLLYDNLGFTEGHWRAFLIPFQPAIWLMRIDTEFYQGSRLSYKSVVDGTEYYRYTAGENLFLVLGIATALICLIFVVCIGSYLLHKALLWATKEGG
jgi:hypothetical protein